MTLIVLVGAHFAAPKLTTSDLIDGVAAHGVLVIAAALAGVACWRRKGQRSERSAWILLSGYCSIWALGQGAAAVLDGTSRGPNAFPSVADVLVLLAVPLGVAAVVAMASGSAPTRWSRRALDGLYASLCLLFVGWAFVMGPLLRVGGSTKAVTVAFAFPALDAAIVTAAVLTLPAIRRPARRSASLILVGLCANAVANGFFAYLAATRRFEIGTAIDLGWIIGFLLIAEGAMATATTPREPRPSDGIDRSSLIALMAPLFMFIPAIATSLIVVVHRGGLEPRLVLIGLAAIATLLVRQALTLGESEDRARHLALQGSFDFLTGVASRERFTARLDAILATTPRCAAIVVIDIDDFKDVNDRLGHGAGNALLVEVSRRLGRGLREGDLLARLGGDEFAILVCSAHATAEGVAVAERVREITKHPVTIHGHEVTWAVSIGLAVDDSGHETADSMLRQADLAMYAAKRAGKDRYEIYEPHMLAGVVERLEMVHELERAIENEEFVLFFQPTLDLESGQVVGAEALIRWEHPTRGLLRPVEFIEIAEGAGLMPRIGRQVLDQACAAAGSLRADGLITDAFDLCINVAPQQLADERFVDDVAHALVRGCIPASMVVLELTESTLIDRVAALPVLESLKSLGVWLAVDDFGTGYSSLSYLQHLPIDILKIDRSFVSEVDRGIERQAMVRAVISISQSLHLLTIAEGIERPSQAEQLRKLGCSLGQGYLYAEPMPAASLVTLLRDRTLINLN